MATFIFIYNANSSKINAVYNAFHKLISPSTYPCSLCALTYGNFSEKKKWKQFKDRTNSELLFLHKDEFEEDFPEINTDYPTVLKKEKNKVSLIMGRERLDDFKNVEELISALEAIL